ncbi:hypothetical protein SAY87_024709 [Trapa incisa]|uniref:DUF4408 domain-containing protein n=2 Tax=Trapa TaxID=22665 RepID=A0AAN7LQJ9_TRANT|nr:hypothetical protein SAY87_024709 [Trapa incisa]KAK4789119.1 hypothetical protein SAY86_020438 [Trapa natans]
MGSFDIGAFKLEKAHTSQRSNIRKIASFLRAVELCIVLVVICRLSTQVPSTVKNSREYFRGLRVLLVSPVFVFVICNVLVVTLFSKSGKLSAQDPALNIDCFYHKCLEESRRSRHLGVKDAQQRIQTYRRVHSEKSIHQNEVNLSCVLYGSKTGEHLNGVCSGEKPEKGSSAEDAISNEEFRKIVEDFIARQKKFRMEEEHNAT